MGTLQSIAGLFTVLNETISSSHLISCWVSPRTPHSICRNEDATHLSYSNIVGVECGGQSGRSHNKIILESLCLVKCYCNGIVPSSGSKYRHYSPLSLPCPGRESLKEVRGEGWQHLGPGFGESRVLVNQQTSPKLLYLTYVSIFDESIVPLD
jgi:hypothetical protein